MEEFINFVVGFVPADYVSIVTAVIALASAVAAITPTPDEGTVWHTIYKFIVDLPALNIGKAKD